MQFLMNSISIWKKKLVKADLYNSVRAIAQYNYSCIQYTDLRRFHRYNKVTLNIH